MIRTFLVLIALTMAKPGFAEQVLTVARAPQLSYLTTSKTWTPFIDYLSKKLEVRFELKIYRSRAKFENDIVRGVPDLFFGNPGYAIIGKTQNGYLPVVRSGKRQLKGILVVSESSEISTIDQLKHQKIAFPDEGAFAASLYLQSLLKKQGIEFTPEYVQGHDNVYRVVAAKRFAAGGGVHRTLDRERANLRSKLRIIYETPGMAPHPLVIHPRVNKELRDAITDTIVDMENSEEGRAILKLIKIQSPVKADYRRDYELVEPLALDMYSYLF